MARLFLTSGQAYGYVGSFEPATAVFGTNAQETVYVLPNGKATFDPSFNRGGDKIVIGDPDSAGSTNSDDYFATLVGSNVILTSQVFGGASIAIPVGEAGTTIKFDDGSFTLIATSTSVKIGNQVITATANRLDHVAAPAASAALSVEADAVEHPAPALASIAQDIDQPAPDQPAPVPQAALAALADVDVGSFDVGSFADNPYLPHGSFDFAFMPGFFAFG